MFEKLMTDTNVTRLNCSITPLVPTLAFLTHEQTAIKDSNRRYLLRVTSRKLLHRRTFCYVWYNYRFVVCQSSDATFCLKSSARLTKSFTKMKILMKIQFLQYYRPHCFEWSEYPLNSKVCYCVAI